MLEHDHHRHVWMVEGVGQCGMVAAAVQYDVHVRVVVEERSYLEEVGLDYVEVVQVELTHHHDGHHHEREEVEVLVVSELQVVRWPSQFHHAALQTRR